MVIGRLPLFALLILGTGVKSEDISCSRLLEHLRLNQQNQDLRSLYEHKQFMCLIASRLKIGQDVALYKWQHKKAIFDPIREKFILASMVARANSSGINSIWAKAFFTDQMEANRKLQEHLFGLWKCNNVSLATTPPIDLFGSIRPRLDAINKQLIQLARDTTSLRTSQWCSPITASQVLNIEHEFDFDANEAAIYHDYSLRDICVA